MVYGKAYIFYIRFDMFSEIPSDTKRLNKSKTALISRASMSINNKIPVAVESAAAGGQELSMVLKTAPYRKHRAPSVSTEVMGGKKE